MRGKYNIVKVKKEDNNFQKFEVLKRNRNKRHKYQEFFVEGVKNINEAIKNKWEINSFIYSGDKELSNWAKEILGSVKVEKIFELTQELLGKLSEKEDTSELIAIVSMKPDNIKRMKVRDKFLIAVFDRPSNKGNLGTIIRSCDAMGCDGLIITGHSVDLYDPDTIVSTMGSFFKLPVIRLQSYAEIDDWVASFKSTKHEIQIVGTSPYGECRLDECDFNKSTVFLIGNETDGLSRNYMEISDKLVKIPMGGSADSLNVACATSIVLYEINRQRNFADI